MGNNYNILNLAIIPIRIKRVPRISQVIGSKNNNWMIYWNQCVKKNQEWSI